MLAQVSANSHRRCCYDRVVRATTFRPSQDSTPVMTPTIDTDSSEAIILGFDPGRQKCGLALMGVDRRLYFHQVVAADAVIATINNLGQTHAISVLVMGDQTTAKEWQQRLHQGITLEVPILSVNERYSTLEARQRYWEMYPPKGLLRLIPKGMRQVKQPIDDIVAIILIERYLAQRQ